MNKTDYRLGLKLLITLNLNNLIFDYLTEEDQYVLGKIYAYKIKTYFREESKPIIFRQIGFTEKTFNVAVEYFISLGLIKLSYGNIHIFNKEFEEKCFIEVQNLFPYSVKESGYYFLKNETNFSYALKKSI